MPKLRVEPRVYPVGNQLVRLRDLSLDTRLRALSDALREAKDEREAQRLLELTLEPGDAGGRIAA